MSTQETVSNPDIEDRLNPVEEVEAMTKVKDDQIEELVEQIEECEEISQKLGKVKAIAQEALDNGKANGAVGEVTCILLNDLFGRSGIGESKLMPNLESFKSDKTAPAALQISIEAIGVAIERIENSVTLGKKQIIKNQRDMEVAVEAFKDSFRDFFVRSTKEKDVQAIKNAAHEVREAAGLQFRDRSKMEGGKYTYAFTGSTPLNFVFKGFEPSKNLATDLVTDAGQIKRLGDLLGTITSLVGSAKEGELADTSNLESQLAGIDELLFLGTVSFTVNKKNTKATAASLSDYVKTGAQKISSKAVFITGIPLLAVPFGGFALVGYAAGSILGSVIHNKMTAGAREQIDSTFRRSQEKFRPASETYASALEAFADKIPAFLEAVSKEKKSDDEKLRNAIRVGHGVVSTVLKISNIAESFYKKL